MSEVEPLRPLASSGFQESNVTNEVEDVRKRKDSSPLAVALAGLVDQARGSKRMAMLGAILGAHAARGARGADDSRDGLAEIPGAIVGASMFETHRMLEDMIYPVETARTARGVDRVDPGRRPPQRRIVAAYR